MTVMDIWVLACSIPSMIIMSLWLFIHRDEIKAYKNKPRKRYQYPLRSHIKFAMVPILCASPAYLIFFDIPQSLIVIPLFTLLTLMIRKTVWFKYYLIWVYKGMNPNPVDDMYKQEG